MEQRKYWLSYLPAGEFGNKPLWGIMRGHFLSSSWIAFYATREEALAAFPEAIQL